MISLIKSYFPKYPNQARTNDSDPSAELSALSNVGATDDKQMLAVTMEVQVDLLNLPIILQECHREETLHLQQAIASQNDNKIS